MKRLYNISYFIFSICLFGCVENDFIDDAVEERLSIVNPINEIELGTQHQFEAIFFDDVGQQEVVNLQWESSSPNVASISPTGLLSALEEGITNIRVITNVQDGREIAEDISVTVTASPVIFEPLMKSGVIVTTSSYLLQGDFIITELENSNNIEIQIMGNYAASTSLPGLYLYLTNNPNSISGALEIGPVEVFNGAHSYIIENIGINDYSHLLYWCKPFTVKVGEGQIND